MVINLEVPRGVVVERITKRRVCTTCGTNYSVDAPPTHNWTCDVCGGEVVQRPDDTEEAVLERLALYASETAAPAPVLRGEGFPDHGRRRSGTPDEVTRRAVAAVDGRHRQS